MNSSDIAGFVVSAAVSLWWLIAPESVIRYYALVSPPTRLKLLPTPKPRTIRIIGAAGTILLLSIFI
jgi:hypothetical protein